MSSGHSAYPKLLDSKDGNPIGVKGLPVIRVSPILDFSKQFKLFRRFLWRHSVTPSEADRALELFVGELKDAYPAANGERVLEAPAVGVRLGWACAEPHVDAELAHLESHVQQHEPEVRSRLSFGFLDNGQVEHHKYPHQPIPRKHGGH